MSFGFGEHPSYYDTALVCLNGHIVNDRAEGFPQRNVNYCPQCGKVAITICGVCKARIRGDYVVAGLIAPGPSKPEAYCYNCGEPYPWTKTALEAAKELIQLSDALSQAEKDDFVNAVRDTTQESPRASVAVQKIKIYSKKVGTEIAGGVKDILVNIASDAVRKVLFPGSSI